MDVKRWLATAALAVPFTGALAAPAQAPLQKPLAALPEHAAAAPRPPFVMATLMRSTDLDRSTRFYTEGLGMVLRGRVPQESLTELFFVFEGREQQTGLMVFQKHGPDARLPVDHGNARSTVILRVPDIAASAERLKSAGYAPSPIRAHGPYKVLEVNDPDGHRFELVQPP